MRLATHDLFDSTCWPTNQEVVYSNFFNKYRDDFRDGLPVYKEYPDHLVDFDDLNLLRFTHDDIAYILFYFFSLELEYYIERDFNLTFDFDSNLKNNTWYDFTMNLYTHFSFNSKVILDSDVAKMIISNEDWYDKYVAARPEEREQVIQMNKKYKRSYIDKIAYFWLKNVVRKRSKILFNGLDLSYNVRMYSIINGLATDYD